MDLRIFLIVEIEIKKFFRFLRKGFLENKIKVKFGVEWSYFFYYVLKCY